MGRLETTVLGYFSPLVDQSSQNHVQYTPQ